MFVYGISPLDIQSLSASDIVYWHARAYAFEKRRNRAHAIKERIG